MRPSLFAFSLPVLAAGFLLSAAPAAQAADDYVLDGIHSSISFQIQHSGISWVHGRFNDFSGKFTVDSKKPSKSAFSLSIKVASVDSNNARRDGHLRGPDFFNVKQYPALTFKSTSVKMVRSGLQVTGDFTMHGKTKSITFTLHGGKTTEFPKGTKRIGYSTDIKMKRSDFGMNKMLPAVGDEVRISISMQGVKK